MYIFTPRTLRFYVQGDAYVYNLRSRAFLVHPTPRLAQGLAPKTFFKTLHQLLRKLDGQVIVQSKTILEEQTKQNK